MTIGRYHSRETQGDDVFVIPANAGNHPKDNALVFRKKENYEFWIYTHKSGNQKVRFQRKIEGWVLGL